MLPLLRSVLRRSYEGDAWHGPALADVLTSIDAATALERPIAGAHSIWELTHHLAGWTREVARRLRGASPGWPPEGDFPPPGAVPDASMPAAERDAAWARLRAELDAARADVLAALAEFPPERLNERMEPTPGTDPNTRPSFGGMVIGLAEHNAYHGGQITILRRAIAGLPACSPQAAASQPHLPTEREPTAPAAEAISES